MYSNDVLFGICALKTCVIRKITKDTRSILRVKPTDIENHLNYNHHQHYPPHPGFVILKYMCNVIFMTFAIFGLIM